MEQPRFSLPDHRVVSLTGRDAIAFAQAQFMSDVANLASGQWQWSGWLTPKGRVIALFALLRHDDGSLWLILPDSNPTEFAERLQRFVFRSKLSIAVRDDLSVSGAFAPMKATELAMADIQEDGTVELDVSASGGPRSLVIDASDAAIPRDDTALTRWAAFDLRHGLPRLDSTQVEQWTPQQLSLDRLNAYSVRKGCYPGQEIVARTHFLGKAKRGLVLFETAAAIAVGSEVCEGDAVIGKVVSAASDIALAVLPLDREFADLSVDGIALRGLPLQDGLAR